MDRKLKSGILAGLLLIVATVGGTLAYFSQRTETKKNVFTMGSAITGELKEPSWDHDSFTGEAAPIGEKGMDLAKTFYPSLTIPKDPAIKNISAVSDGKKADAWVAIQLEYRKADIVVAFTELDKFIDIDFNDDDWIISDDGRFVYYKLPLTAGEKTTPVFTNVHIDELAITVDQFENNMYPPSIYDGLHVEDYVISDFEIIATGYLVQLGGFDNAQDAMKAAFQESFN